jgi:serine-type D-Ala-D-Ala carboxypeptidase (penicillin-binding protein 5/6)
VRAAEAILEDADTGQVLFDLHDQARRPIASLTKVMTALLVLERTNPDDVVKVTQRAASVGGVASVLGLRSGERITVRALLYALMLQSANDAAIALAERVSGTEGAFVSLMNRRADELGLGHSRFFSPNGLDDRGHSTAFDLARLTRIAEGEPEFVDIVRTKVRTVRSISGPTRRVQNRNVLLWLYPDATGVKTGFTTPAGHCLIASAERGGRRLIAVIMGAPTDQAAFDDGAALLNFGFDGFASVSLLTAGEAVGVVTVEGMTVDAVAGRTVTRLVERDQAASVSRTLIPLPGLSLPVAAGERVGRVIVFAGGRKVASGVAVATAAVGGPAAAHPSSPPRPGGALDDAVRVLGLVVRSLFGSFL